MKLIKLCAASFSVQEEGLSEVYLLGRYFYLPLHQSLLNLVGRKCFNDN